MESDRATEKWFPLERKSRLKFSSRKKRGEIKLRLQWTEEEWMENEKPAEKFLQRRVYREAKHELEKEKEGDGSYSPAGLGQRAIDQGGIGEGP